MKINCAKYFLLLVLGSLVLVVLSGCGEDDIQPYTIPVRTHSATTGTSTTPVPAGLALDPNLQSATGTPTAAEMKPLIALQAKVPYPVEVPTQLPSGYQLDADLIGSSAPTTKDPVGYYSFRYSDPSNPNRTLTFNQSGANSKPLSGYYLTEEEINGVQYSVYWHKTREYLPSGEPVRTVEIGDAEVFIVIWKSQFTDASGTPRELWYSLSTGTWTGHGWGDIRNMLENLKPLSTVGS